MATLSQLRVMVRRHLSLADTSDSSASPPQSTEITDLINAARDEMWREIAPAFAMYLSQTTTMTYTASTESVSLPAATQKRIILEVQLLPTAATNAADRYQLKPRTIAELDEYELTGDPIAYAIDWGSNTMRVRPLPTANATLYIRYVPGLTALSADGDTPSEWPSEHHRIIAAGAAAIWLADKGDTETVRPQVEFDAGKLALRAYMDRVFRDTHIHSRTPTRFF